MLVILRVAVLDRLYCTIKDNKTKTHTLTMGATKNMNPQQMTYRQERIAADANRGLKQSFQMLNRKHCLVRNGFMESCNEY